MEKRKQLTLCALGLGLLMIACGILLTGVPRMLILAVLYVVEMEALMMLLFPKPDGPKLSKEEKIKAEDQWYFERQDPGKLYGMRRVGRVMNVVAIVLMVVAMLFGARNPLLGMLCMGCCLICVGLCIFCPAYFALCHDEKAKNRDHHFPVVNLMIPYAIPLFCCASSYQHVMVIDDWIRVVEAMLLVGAVIGTVLRFLAAECRRNPLNWVVALVLACVCAIGFVLPLNELLEKEEPVVISGIVTDFQKGTRSSPSRYEVELDNGETVDMPMNRRFYDDGVRIELEYHTGGLGIEYYTYAD